MPGAHPKTLLLSKTVRGGQCHCRPADQGQGNKAQKRLPMTLIAPFPSGSRKVGGGRWMHTAHQVSPLLLANFGRPTRQVFCQDVTKILCKGDKKALGDPQEGPPIPPPCAGNQFRERGGGWGILTQPQPASLLPERPRRHRHGGTWKLCFVSPGFPINTSRGRLTPARYRRARCWLQGAPRPFFHPGWEVGAHTLAPENEAVITGQSPA